MANITTKNSLKKLNFLVRFLCFMGGARLDILKHVPSEKYKFMAIGVGVLNTALLSMVTMGFAIVSVAQKFKVEEKEGVREIISLPFTESQIIMLVFFSLFWGFIIFGIDWGLVSTMRKKYQFKWKKDIWPILFRLGVATLISFTVSRPLETVVFQDFLPATRREMQIEYQNRLNAAPENMRGVAQKQVDSKQQAWAKWDSAKNEAYENDPQLKRIQEKKQEQQVQEQQAKEKADKENEQSDNIIRTNENSIAQINTKIQGIRQDIQSKRTIIYDKNNRVSALEKTNKQNEADIIAAELKINNIRQDSIVNYVQVSELENRIGIFQSNITKNKQEISQLKEDISSLKNEITNLNTREQALINSKTPFEEAISKQRGDKRRRQQLLDSLGVIITATEAIENERFDEIGKENKAKSDSLDVAIREAEQAQKEINKIAEKEMLNNQKVSMVFLYNNLINNIIAVGQLEKWSKSEDVAKQEIAKKVSFVRWLLILVILIIDIAPIVIKLLTARGPYDRLVESMEEVKVRERELEESIAFKEISANKRLVEELAYAQREVMSKAIKEWKEDQETNMTHNYRNFINTETDKI